MQSVFSFFLSFLSFFCFCFLDFFGHTHSVWKFLGQGSNLSHSFNLCHSQCHSWIPNQLHHKGTSIICFNWLMPLEGKDRIMRLIQYFLKLFVRFIFHSKLLGLSVRILYGDENERLKSMLRKLSTENMRQEWREPHQWRT